ncbi:MAG: lipoyl synthase [Acidimicrobiales bacterium]
MTAKLNEDGLTLLPPDQDVLKPLRVRWLGQVRYGDAGPLQRALHDSGRGDYLLLLEHPSVYTLGVRTKHEHLLAGVESSGAEVVRADRGGDVTYHGPGQLVGYPIVDVPGGHGSIPGYVHLVEELVIGVAHDLGISTGRLPGYPGVWVDPEGSQPRKLCAVGVRVDRGRSMHGFALNVDVDLSMFDNIVPCGIADKAVTSLRAEGVAATMRDVVEATTARAGEIFAFGHGRRSLDRQYAAFTLTQGGERSEPREERPLVRRLAAAGVDTSTAVRIHARKPLHLLKPVHLGPRALSLKRELRGRGLVTVCEEAGCPNLSECWSDGTATFMINGDRCTRACGFCLVDTRRPGPLDRDEPARVAAAVESMGLSHAVVTAVARDDLCDGGAAAFAATIAAIRRLNPSTSVEVLIPDLKGADSSLSVVFDARPDVLNHNVETVNRLQRAVRPSASYARSLSVLARAKRAGLVTKSSLMVGLGEGAPEVLSTLFDLRAVGVDIVTIGHYLRPSAAHLPVARWWKPEEFDELRASACALGFAHVECSPLTRSSYHARQASEGAHAALVST